MSSKSNLNTFLETFVTKPGDKVIAVKDNICTLEGHTTAASRMLENFQSPYEATVVTRLKQAGFAIAGKTNLDEFAMGSSTEYSAFGVTQNPWDQARVAGGSSGGSAAAVAAGQVEYALGTDTGGSIRQPASFCGVVGTKPTYGRVSRFGVIAYGSSLDQVGPITKSVAQSAQLLSIIAGQDAYDATSSALPVPDYTAGLGKEVAGMRIGIPKEWLEEGVEDSVRQSVEAAIAQLKNLGCILESISLPLTNAAIPVYFLIAKAEGATNLARFDAIRYSPLGLNAKTLIEQYIEARGQGFGPEVKRTILMGTYALSAGYVDAWYKQASKVRTLIRSEFEEAFRKVDILAGPTTPNTAFLIGAKADDPLSMYMQDALTVPQNLAGVPAISIPCGFVEDLPVGLQLTASHFQEEKLFQLAHAFESHTNWHQRTPAKV